MQGKRVLIIVENLPVPFDRRVWLEATTLTRAGYQVSVICPKGPGYDASFEMRDGVAIYRHPLPHEGSGPLGYLVEYGTALFWQFVLATRIAFTRGFDVIHACNPPDLIFIVGAAFKLLGKRFVFDHHDLSPEMYESKFNKKGTLHSLLGFFERLTFRTADVVVSTNESYRKIAMQRGSKSPDKVFVVRTGPDVSRWPERPSVDPRWRNGRRYLVGYVGVMGEAEGLDLLLETIRIIVFERGRRDIQFVLVGDGIVRKEMEALAHRLGLDGYVTFTGRVSDQELMSALGSADVCVNPDRFTAWNDKSTMNKILEYMALSKPIVQSDLTEGRVSAAESSLYARHDDTGDFADKILELIDDPARRAAMGAAGRRRVERELAWQHQAPNLLAAYRAVFAPS